MSKYSERDYRSFNPPSSEQLIQMYSHARVITHGPKYISGYMTNPDGTIRTGADGKPWPILSNELTDEKVKQSIMRIK